MPRAIGLVLFPNCTTSVHSRNKPKALSGNVSTTGSNNRPSVYGWRWRRCSHRWRLTTSSRGACGCCDLSVESPPLFLFAYLRTIVGVVRVSASKQARAMSCSKTIPFRFAKSTRGVIVFQMNEYRRDKTSQNAFLHEQIGDPWCPCDRDQNADGYSCNQQGCFSFSARFSPSKMNLGGLWA